MSLELIATVLGATSLVLVGLACVGDLLALRQMSTERYRWVPFVRLLRWQRVMALMPTLSLLSLCAAASPLATVLAVAVTASLVLLAHSPAVWSVDKPRVAFGALVPACLVALLLLNQPWLPLLDARRLPLDAWALTAFALAAAGFAFTAEMRVRQGLLRWRD